ncbi:MAG: inlA, partial [Verrucomicrobiaceae bacterium]|nr:inlA [Verrucomicrobiaceae bacterium]
MKTGLPLFLGLAFATLCAADDKPAPKPAEAKPAAAAAAPAPTAPPAAKPATPAPKPADAKPATPAPAKPADPKAPPAAAKPATPPATAAKPATPATAKPVDPKAPPAPAKPAATPAPAVAKPAPPPPPKPVSIFKDKNLEAAVRKQVFTKRDNAEPIVAADVETVAVVEGRGMGIKDLSGLEKCTQLASLTLPKNQITDISALKGLERLQFVDLSDNQVS